MSSKLRRCSQRFLVGWILVNLIIVFIHSVPKNEDYDHYDACVRIIFSCGFFFLAYSIGRRQRLAKRGEPLIYSPADHERARTVATIMAMTLAIEELFRGTTTAKETVLKKLWMFPLVFAISSASHFIGLRLVMEAYLYLYNKLSDETFTDWFLVLLSLAIATTPHQTSDTGRAKDILRQMELPEDPMWMEWSVWSIFGPLEPIIHTAFLWGALKCVGLVLRQLWTGLLAPFRCVRSMLQAFQACLQSWLDSHRQEENPHETLLSASSESATPTDVYEGIAVEMV